MAALVLPALAGAADPLASTTQLVAVTAPGWDSPRGVLERYERLQQGTPWRLVGKRVPVMMGRNGLALGEGAPIQARGDGPAKKEGDKRSPAGLFRIGAVYGAAPASDLDAGRIRMPYRQISEGLECVDDPASAEYNRISTRQGAAAWKSAENMAELAAREYKWMAVIEQNPSRSPGRGSCVFLHVGHPADPTSGCTALAEEDLIEILQWLDPDRRPMLVQTPAAVYGSLRAMDGTRLDLPERAR